MRFIYFIMLGIIITSTNLTAYSYDEEDVRYFLKNSKCHQCDLSNYNFEKKYLDQVVISESTLIGTNFNNAKIANSRIRSSAVSIHI